MSKKIQRTNKKKTIITAMAVIVVLVLGLTAANWLQIRKDAVRFAKTKQEMQTVFDELTQKLDTPTKTEVKDVCYNSEHAPYNNGRTWCQLAMAAYLDVEMPNTTVRELFTSVAISNGHNVLTSSSSNLAFNSSEGMSCSLDIYNGALATDPVYFLPKDPNAKQLIVVRCADRAKAKHYTYVD